MVTDLARVFLRRVLSTFLAAVLSAVAMPHPAAAASPAAASAPAANHTPAAAAEVRAEPARAAVLSGPPVAGWVVTVPDRTRVLAAQLTIGVPTARAPPLAHV